MPQGYELDGLQQTASSQECQRGRVRGDPAGQEEGQVFPTLEAVVTETPAELRRVMHPDLGVALIDLDRSES